MNSRSLVTTAPRQLTIAEADLTGSAQTPEQVMRQVALIQQVMSAAMKDGEHYGKIPGCGDKPALLKPGAEKLIFTFRLAPSYDTRETKSEHGHREYQVVCTLTSIMNGAVVGQGLGLCSTMESKYRYRGEAAEVTDRPVPKAYWDARNGGNLSQAQEILGGKGFTTKKVEGQGWMIAKKSGEKTEHPDIADTYNTVLKMAKKRALVDAVLTATAASDIFTQDVEEISANLAASEAHHASARRDERPSEPIQEAEIVEERPAPAPVQPVRGSIKNVEEKKTAKKGTKVFIVTITPDGGSDVRTSTFSESLSATATTLSQQGDAVIAGIRPARQAGFFDLVSLEPADAVDADHATRTEPLDYPDDAPSAATA